MSFLPCFFVLLMILVIHYLSSFSVLARSQTLVKQVMGSIFNVLPPTVRLNEWLCFFAIVLPIVALMYLILVLVQAILSDIGSMLLVGLMLWCFLDINPSGETDPAKLLYNRFSRCFAPILWFICFGLTGFILYIVCCNLVEIEGLGDNLQFLSRKVTAYLNWVPERVLGLALALVGFFHQSFKVWLKGLLTTPNMEQGFLLECAMASLDPKQREKDHQLKCLDELLIRALVLWMMVLVFIAFGVLLG